MVKVNMNFGKYRWDDNIIVEGKDTRDIEYLHLSVPEDYKIDSIEFASKTKSLYSSWHSMGVYTPETHPQFFINK